VTLIIGRRRWWRDLGEATALAFAQEDANGAVADLAAESAEETVAPINRAGSQAMSLRGDITNATAVI
jgi:NAD(P)-dependent dehydrogenase (short-subunit alcohol dehydrogenase family)